MNEMRPAVELRSILDAEALRHRLEEETARVRRSGGFLSLALQVGRNVNSKRKH